MPAIYLCDVIGTGTPRDPWRPSITTVTGDFVALMIDSGPRKKSIVWCQDVALAGTGIILAISAPTKDELIATMQTTTVPNNRRNQINSWLSASGYNTVPAALVTWYEVIIFACQQVNPAVDLSVLLL